MSAQDRNKARVEEDRARAALSHVLEAGSLPEKSQAPARVLLDRLETPVRIAIMGLPGTGRSQVLNLLAGDEIVPDLGRSISLPTVELVHSETSRSILTMPDGTTETRDDIDLAGIATSGPALVQMQTNLPALKRISLLEVAAGSDQTEQARALVWAAKRSDMAIWCTREFGTAEQQVWDAAPESLKADSVLLRTHADLLLEPHVLVRVLRQQAGDSFDQVLAIDTPTALAARNAPGGADRFAFKASGGQGLISSVLRMVERQRALVVDQVDLLLMRALGTTDPMRPASNPVVADVIDEIAATDATPAEAVEPAEPAVEPEEKDEKQADAKARRKSKLREKSKALAKVKAKADAKDADAAAKEVADKADPVRAALEAGVSRLTDAGAALISDEAAPSDMMDRSVAELIWLSEHFDSAEAKTPEPLLAQARDRATDASDMAQLMQLEEGEEAAIEAVALMIQMRRTLSQELAQKLAA